MKIASKRSGADTGSRKAFTLVELLVVIGVIAMLAMLLAPALASSNGRVRRTVCANNLRELGLGTAIYAEHYDTRYPITQAGANQINRINGGYYTRWIYFNSNKPDFHLPKSWDNFGDTPDSTAGTFWRNFGMLYPENLAGDGSIFYCPELTAKNSFLGATGYQPLLTTTDFSDGGSNPGSVRGSYIYNPWVNSSNDRLYVKTSDVKARKVFGLDHVDGTTWNADGTINPNSFNFAHSREGGWNILYTDGSVEFFRADFRTKQVYTGLGGFPFPGTGSDADIQGICNMARLVFERF